LRLAGIKTLLHKPVIGAVILALGGLSGCQNAGTEDMFGKSFLAPQEMMRLTHNQIPLPILNKLSGLDEPNEEFALARNVIADDLRVDATDYVIGRNDLLSISLTDVTPGIETQKTTRVSESGYISLPLVGQVPAAGFTESQLNVAIAQKYRDGGFAKAAEVSVTVIEARQRTFQVRGAVNRPGQYAIIQSDFRVLDALVLAGDTSAPASTIEYLYVIRPLPVSKVPASQPSTQPTGAPAPLRGPTSGPGLLEPKTKSDVEKSDATSPAPTPGATLEDTTKTDGKNAPVFVNGAQPLDPKTEKPTVADPATPPPSGTTPAAENSRNFEFNAPLPEDQSTIIRVPIRQLLNGELKYNIIIRPQDTMMIPVPEAGEFYMAGHVARVGVYSLTGRQITLKQAVISAGMLDEVAIPERTDIIRRIGRDKEVFVRVNLTKVFEGKQPDFFLKPYDVVQVGTNALAPFIAAIRNGFRITYGFGFLYDRNFYLDPQQQAAGNTGRRTTTR
jgi:polysaccharide export outer membrane protein